MAFFSKKTPPLTPHFRQVRFGFNPERVKIAENNLTPDEENETQLTYQLGLLGLIWILNYYFLDQKLDKASLETSLPSAAESFPYYTVLQSLLSQKYGEPYLKDFTNKNKLLSGWFGNEVLVLITLNSKNLEITYNPPILLMGFNLNEI